MVEENKGDNVSPEKQSDDAAQGQSTDSAPTQPLQDEQPVQAVSSEQGTPVPPYQGAEPAQPTQPAQPVPPTQQSTQPVPAQGQPVPPYQGDATQAAPPYQGDPTQQVPPYQGDPTQGVPPYQGQPQAYGQPMNPNQGMYAEKPESGKATAALVCGIASILIPFLGLILGIVAIVLGVQYTNKYGKDGKATGGKITGAVGIVLTILYTVLTIAFGAFIFAVVDEYDKYDYDYNYNYNSQSEPDEPALNAERIENQEALDKEAVEDLSGEYLAELMVLDDAEIDEIAQFLDVAMTEQLNDDGYNYSLKDMGIDSREFAEWWVADRSYTITDSYVYGDEAFVSADVTCTDMLEFSRLLLESYGELSDPSVASSIKTEADALNWVGDKMKDAMKDTGTTTQYVSLDFDRVGGEWVLDEDSYYNALEIIYGYDFE